MEEKKTVRDVLIKLKSDIDSIDLKTLDVKTLKQDYSDFKIQYNKNEEVQNVKLKEFSDKLSLLSSVISTNQTALNDIKNEIVEIKKQLII